MNPAPPPTFPARRRSRRGLRLFWLGACLASVLGAALPPLRTFSALADPWLGTPVYVVDSLADSAEGEPTVPHTLRWALEQLGPEGGVVVFRRSGTIRLARKLQVPASARNWLIAGYTAPAPGILLVHDGLEVRGQHWSVEHLRIRPGAKRYGEQNGDQNDAFGVTGSRAVTEHPDPAFREAHAIRHGRVLHCSFSWSSDEIAQNWYPPIHHIDYAYCIFTEPMHAPDLHPKPEIHAFGPLVSPDTEFISYQRSILANALRRNPRITDGAAVFVADCAILNPGGAGIEVAARASYTPRVPGERPIPRPHRLAITGNLFVPGPSTQPATRLITQATALDPTSVIHARGNWRWDGAGWQRHDETAALEVEQGEPFTSWSPARPLQPEGYSPSEPTAVDAELQARAGAFPRHRDATDLRAIAQLARRTGQRIERHDDPGLDRHGHPHDADGYEILPERRWSDGADPRTAWALPTQSSDAAALRAWLEVKRALVEGAPAPAAPAAD